MGTVKRGELVEYHVQGKKHLGHWRLALVTRVTEDEDGAVKHVSLAVFAEPGDALMPVSITPQSFEGELQGCWRHLPAKGELQGCWRHLPAKAVPKEGEHDSLRPRV